MIRSDEQHGMDITGIIKWRDPMRRIAPADITQLGIPFCHAVAKGLWKLVEIDVLYL